MKSIFYFIGTLSTLSIVLLNCSRNDNNMSFTNQTKKRPLKI